MHLSFHGADRSVTGSCHMVECAGKRILIDCGLHQGSRELDEENASPFGFEAASIDYLLLTHAHLDHCGRLPLLAKRGFRGEIIATAASRELARLVILDSAHLQEEDARYHARKLGQHDANGDLRKAALFDLGRHCIASIFSGELRSMDKPLMLPPACKRPSLTLATSWVRPVYFWRLRTRAARPAFFFRAT